MRCCGRLGWACGLSVHSLPFREAEMQLGSYIILECTPQTSIKACPRCASLYRPGFCCLSTWPRGRVIGNCPPITTYSYRKAFRVFSPVTELFIQLSELTGFYCLQSEWRASKQDIVYFGVAIHRPSIFWLVSGKLFIGYCPNSDRIWQLLTLVELVWGEKRFLAWECHLGFPR